MTEQTPGTQIATTDSFAAAAVDPVAAVYEDIIVYKNATPEQKAVLDERIARIDVRNLNAITQFGKESAEKLGSSSGAILEKIQATQGFIVSLSGLRGLLSKFDFKAVGAIAKKYTEKLALAASGNPFRRLFNKLGGKVPSIDDLSHEINKSILQLSDVMASLEQARDKIPGLVEDLQTLENARLESYKDFGLDVAAAVEVYRRLKEETVPALEKEVKSSPSKLQELRNMRIAMTVLNKKATDMNAFHKTSLIQLETIDDLQQALAMSQLNIDNHLNVSQEQWKALLAESATAAQVAGIADTVRQADEFGDKVFEQSQTISDMAKAVARSSFARGAVNPEIIIKHLEKKTLAIAEDLKFTDQFNASQEQTRARLDQAGAKLRAAALQVNAPVDSSVIDVEATVVTDQPKPSV